MPTYEYACTECDERIEVVQSFSDDPLTVCPRCGGSLRKVFGAVGIVLKGSGFYKTDSRTAGKGRAGSARSGEDKSAAAPEGGSSPAPASDGASTTGSTDAGGSAKGSPAKTPASSSATP